MIREIAAIERTELARRFGVPATPQELRAIMRRFGRPVDMDVAQEMHETINEILNQVADNLSEFPELVKQRDITDAEAPVEQGHSLRRVDNAFRHGLKILLHDALPADRQFGYAVTGHADPVGEYAIDLYQSETEPKFATIDARPERTEQHVAVIARVCVLIKQVVRGFIAGVIGEPAFLTTLVRIGVDELDLSLQGD
jgi:hypothetical protein